MNKLKFKKYWLTDQNSEGDSSSIQTPDSLAIQYKSI